jgi:hypothetical protein
MASGAANIGYLESREFNGKFLGGLLVVDKQGIPVEFQYTEPVVPDKIQKIIYGKSMNRYLKAEVIARTLWKNLGSKPGLLVVNDNLLFSIWEELKVPMVQLEPTNVDKLENIGDIQTIDENQLLLQASFHSPPVRVWPCSDNAEVLETITRILIGAGEGMDDIVEPSSRVLAALEEKIASAGK